PGQSSGIGAADDGVAAQLGIGGVVGMGGQSGSPADAAGLRAFDPRTGQIGDIIVAVDGKPIATLADLAAALEDAGIGKEVTMKVLRGDAERETKVRVVDLGA